MKLFTGKIGVQENASIIINYTGEKMLYVDDREPPKIFNYLDKKQVVYEKKRLDVGDFVYKSWVFERKSMQDLYGSILDGRIYEQLENMKLNYEHSVVLISGKLSDLNHKYCKYPDSILTVIATILTKHNISVIRCETDYLLIKQLIKICNKVDTPFEGFVKRLRFTGDDVYLNIIMCVPKLGKKKARQIYDKYKLKELMEVKEEDLLLIPGIGKKMAEKIKEIFS